VEGGGALRLILAFGSKEVGEEAERGDEDEPQEDGVTVCEVSWGSFCLSAGWGRDWEGYPFAIFYCFGGGSVGGRWGMLAMLMVMRVPSSVDESEAVMRWS